MNSAVGKESQLLYLRLLKMCAAENNIRVGQPGMKIHGQAAKESLPVLSIHGRVSECG